MTKIQVLSIAVTGGLFLLVFELVRRKRLMERYALLWLFATALMLALAVWQDALNLFAEAVGIQYGPSALFAVGFGFMLVLLLHLTLVLSRLSDQNKLLAQRVGMLQQRLDALSTEQPAPDEADVPLEAASGPRR